MLPQLPDYEAMDPAAMTISELRAAHESLWAWLEKAQSAPLSDAPDDELFEAVEDKFMDVTRERMERQGDEPAPRGG